MRRGRSYKLGGEGRATEVAEGPKRGRSHHQEEMDEANSRPEREGERRYDNIVLQ